MRDVKPGLELVPDVRPQAVARGSSDIVLTIQRMLETQTVMK